MIEAVSDFAASSLFPGDGLYPRHSIPPNQVTRIKAALLSSKSFQTQWNTTFKTATGTNHSSLCANTMKREISECKEYPFQFRF